MNDAGTFASGAGAVSLNGATIAPNGDVAIAADKVLPMTIGSGTFASGTGAVLLYGDVSTAAGKNLHNNGAGTFASGTGAVSLIGATIALAALSPLPQTRTGT